VPTKWFIGLELFDTQGRIKTKLGQMQLFRKGSICIWHSTSTKQRSTANNPLLNALSHT